MTAAARDLVQRLRTCQTERHDRTQARDHVAASRALDLAVSLLDHVDVATLREALLHACNPASTPPVPVVFGPQDRPAPTVTLDEIDALLRRYAQACFEHGQGHGWHGHQAFDELWAAIQGMHLVAFATDLHAQSEGRTP